MSELGKVSKIMCSKITKIVKEKLHLLQWKNTDAVIDWFKQLTNKNRRHFIQFDVVNFYGSISKKLLEVSLTFCAGFTEITEDTRKTIIQAANSFLCSNRDIWIKKDSGTFDITMGGYHGAEVCEMVGLYLLSQLTEIVPKGDIGLYRDDGLAALVGTPRL